MPSCRRCGTDISNFDWEKYGGYCHKCYQEYLDRLFPVFVMRSGLGGSFGLPSPYYLKSLKEKEKKNKKQKAP